MVGEEGQGVAGACDGCVHPSVELGSDGVGVDVCNVDDGVEPLSALSFMARDGVCKLDLKGLPIGVGGKYRTNFGGVVSGVLTENRIGELTTFFGRNGGIGRDQCVKVDLGFEGDVGVGHGENDVGKARVVARFRAEDFFDDERVAVGNEIEIFDFSAPEIVVLEDHERFAACQFFFKVEDLAADGAVEQSGALVGAGYDDGFVVTGATESTKPSS